MRHFMSCNHHDEDGAPTVYLDDTETENEYAHCTLCGLRFVVCKDIPSDFHETMDRLKSGSGIDLSAEVASLRADLKRLGDVNAADKRMITKLQAALGKQSIPKVHCVLLELAPNMVVTLDIKEVSVDERGAHVLVTGGFGVAKL